MTAICSCPERPRCEWDRCNSDAAYSVWQPRWESRPERFKFMCKEHFEMYSAPILGIGRPKHADEYWRPSLAECMKHASIKMSFEKSRSEPDIDPTLIRYGDESYTKAQLEQVLRLRRAIRAESR